MEHIITSSIMKHATTHNILYPLQFGFRFGRSCETQLTGFISDLFNNSMHKSEQIDVLVLDMAKAFDKVGHRRLLKKLEHYGIRGPTNRWINSFLSKRTQTVVFEGSSSYTAPVKSGVPQGSVLGPCMFLLFMNDLPDALTSQVRLFADDTLVYLTVNTQDDAHRLQADLNKLAEWGQRWLMEFNAEKCQVLRVTRRRHIVEHQYTLHGKELETCTAAKYLGITISSDLRWNKHVDEVCSKANKTLGFLRRNLRVSSPKLKTLAYFSLVRPLVEYAAPAWDPHTDKTSTSLKRSKDVQPDLSATATTTPVVWVTWSSICSGLHSSRDERSYG